MRPFPTRIEETALVTRVVTLMGKLIATHRPISSSFLQHGVDNRLARLRRNFAVPFVGTVPAIKPACAAS